MNIKKHIPQENYKGWTEHFPLFAPLTAEEDDVLQNDPQNFQHKFPDIRLFPDPFSQNMQRETLSGSLHEALIVTGNGDAAQRIPHQLQAAIKRQHGIEIPIISDTDSMDFRNDPRPLILIGGSLHNQRSCELAKALQLGVFDGDFPGENGSGIATYHNIKPGCGIRYVVVGEEATGHFVQHAINAKNAQLQWVHQVQLDEKLPQEYHNFDVWLEQYSHTPAAQLTRLLPDLDQWIHSNHKQPYREIFVKVLSWLSERPISPNPSLLDLPLMAIRYYQLTGNEQGLDLFREMLWGFWNYLNSDDPNIYISDMDFRLGQICNYWSWAEHHASFTAEERQKFRLLLLGGMRMAHSYYRHSWAQRKNPEGVRHNHQTFKGRCFLWGWRYFHPFHIADADTWKQDADAVFNGIDASRSKYSENANNYETLSPEHLLAWYEIFEKEVDSDFQRALSIFSQREWALTDNFFYRVEYGDCDVTFGQKKPFQVGPWLHQDTALSSDIKTLEQTISFFDPAIPHAIYGFPNIQSQSLPVDSSQILTGWTHVPLEPKLISQYPLAGAVEKRFDKLVWRSEWKKDASYLAIEGFGNETVSHAHNAANSIIRANCGGRVWLVCNGYGKKIGVKAAGEAYSTRELGPADHNMLLLRDRDGNSITPPVNALLVDSGNDPIPFAVTELADYGGIKWTRHVFVLQELGYICIDSLTPQATKSTFSTASLEWNVLGKVLQNSQGAIIEQSGVNLRFQHFDTATIEWGSNASDSWHRVMKNKEYPYTSHPVQKCILTKPASDDTESLYFVSGFWLEKCGIAATWVPQKRLLEVTFPKVLSSPSAEYTANWGKIHLQQNTLQIHLQSRL